MWPTLLIILYCGAIVAASLAGGWLPNRMRLTHTRLQVMMSLVGGLMLGVAVLHLLPHSVVQTGSLDITARSAVLGLLAMFFMIRVFHVHQHDHAEGAIGGSGHHHDCEHHDHDVHHADEKAGAGRSRLSWIGLFTGLALHTLIDGVALAASVAAGEAHGEGWALLGAGTFLAVVLHKPLDALSITTVMTGSWSPKWINGVNLAFALMCPLGAIAFYLGVRELGEAQHLWVGCALSFSAGVFLCISLADILPELQFHRHDRFKLSAALLIGVALAFLVGLVEPHDAHDVHEEHNHAADE